MRLYNKNYENTTSRVFARFTFWTFSRIFKRAITVKILISHSQTQRSWSFKISDTEYVKVTFGFQWPWRKQMRRNWFDLDFKTIKVTFYLTSNRNRINSIRSAAILPLGIDGPLPTKPKLFLCWDDQKYTSFLTGNITIFCMTDVTMSRHINLVLKRFKNSVNLTKTLTITLTTINRGLLWPRWHINTQ